METSYFFNPNLTPGDPRLVSIARWAPNRPPEKRYQGRRYPALAPPKHLKDLGEEAFRAAFQEILDRLDPRKVFDELGEDAILLCWEKPGEFCHRRLVAEWFEAALGVEIPEYVEPEKQAGLFK